MRTLVMGLAAGLATVAVIAAEAQPSPDFAHAKDLYDHANEAMAQGNYADALRDYSAAYDITHDPVLFWKLGTASEKLATCDAALGYYVRYVKEAKPAAQFVELTKERIAACGRDPAQLLAEPSGGSGAGAASESGSGSASGAGSGSDPGSGSDSGSGAGSDSGSGAGSGLGLGSASRGDKHVRGSDAPWLMVGGALAFVTAGAVLAYSAGWSEQDIQDLYVGLNGTTPAFDAKTMARYNDLVDEGHRYQYLSWGAFGIAAGFGVTAAILFVRDHGEHDQRVELTPHALVVERGRERHDQILIGQPAGHVGRTASPLCIALKKTPLPRVHAAVTRLTACRHSRYSRQMRENMIAKPAHITEALDRLRSALADNVVSATLYGSYVRGDFRADASGINLAVVVRGSDLSSIAAPLREAWRAARNDPWIARADELAGLSDAFATRVRDIQRCHEMLIGDDPWTALVIPRAALRLRIEQELRNHQMRLRHAEVLTDVAGQSWQLHICAGALRLDLVSLEELAGGTSLDAIDALATATSKRLDLPREDIVTVLEYRARHRGDLAVLLATASRLLDRAVAVVDAMEVT